MAGIKENTPENITPQLRGVDADDPVLAKIPPFTFPTAISQYPAAGNGGRLVMRVEVRHLITDELAWSTEYDVLTCGDPK